jgi:hypothetical protein
MLKEIYVDTSGTSLIVWPVYNSRVKDDLEVEDGINLDSDIDNEWGEIVQNVFSEIHVKENLSYKVLVKKYPNIFKKIFTKKGPFWLETKEYPLESAVFNHLQHYGHDQLRFQFYKVDHCETPIIEFNHGIEEAVIYVNTKKYKDELVNLFKICAKRLNHNIREGEVFESHWITANMKSKGTSPEQPPKLADDLLS